MIDRKESIIVLPHIVVALVVYNIYYSHPPPQDEAQGESDKGT